MNGPSTVVHVPYASTALMDDPGLAARDRSAAWLLTTLHPFTLAIPSERTPVIQPAFAPVLTSLSRMLYCGVDE